MGHQPSSKTCHALLDEAELIKSRAKWLPARLRTHTGRGPKECITWPLGYVDQADFCTVQNKGAGKFIIKKNQTQLLAEQ